MRALPAGVVHKIVPLRFSGIDLKFQTTHALFSYHHIDDGTMLLLKTLAQAKSLPRGRILDAGCGYGPLAVTLKKAWPEAEVSARDRLVLAAEFTADNARLNGVSLDVAPELLLDDTTGGWDLIVSNLPAKAGDPVLRDFVPRSLSLLAPGGLVAVVIVETLAPWFATCLEDAQAQVVHTEAGPGYRVFHYRRGSATTTVGEPAFPGAYQRSSVAWSTQAGAFQQKTFFGLPSFDTLDYRTQVSLPLVDRMTLAGDVLVWEPVQGYLATWADRVLAPSACLHLAGNDLLGLKAASANVERRTPVVHPVSSLSGLDLGPGSLGAALVQIHSEPEVPWADEVLDRLRYVLAPGAPVLVNGSSTDLTRFLAQHQGLRVLRDERTKGWRAVLLERQSGK